MGQYAGVTSRASGPVLLYDGTCGLCAASVQLVLRHDPGGVLRFAPLEGAYGRAVRRDHPELNDVDSMMWVEPGHARVFTRSGAALRIARYLGGWWRLALLGWLVPRPLRDAVYRLIARHRHRLTRGGPQCVVPAPEQRVRFLE
jgi:predicted DCC family thiol-disulfide oxidoreductase YuxK